MADKQSKHKGRPRTRTIEQFWEKQRQWSRSYYNRNRDEICIKQKIRYYRNKLIDALNADKVNEADITRLERKIIELEEELETFVDGGHADEEEQK